MCAKKTNVLLSSKKKYHQPGPGIDHRRVDVDFRSRSRIVPRLLFLFSLHKSAHSALASHLRTFELESAQHAKAHHVYLRCSLFLVLVAGSASIPELKGVQGDNGLVVPTFVEK